MKLKKTTIILFIILITNLIFGCFYAVGLNTNYEKVIILIYYFIFLILFFIWLDMDSNYYDFYISKIVKVLIIIFFVPFFWYIFKTRKLKGFIFLLKMIGFILVLWISFAIGFIPIVLVLNKII